MPKGPTLDEVIESTGEEASVSDTMREIMQELEAKGSDADDDSEDDQPRDEFGRFVSKEAEKAEAESATADEPDEETEVKASEESEAEDSEAEEPVEDESSTEERIVIDAPHEWSLEEQNTFREIPDEYKQFVLDRIDAANSTNTELSERVSRYNEMDEMFKPRREAWARSGMDDVSAIRQLLALSDWATRDPEGFAIQYVKNNNIPADRIYDLSGLVQNDVDENIDDEYTDPQVKALRQQISRQNEQIQQLVGTVGDLRTGIESQTKTVEQERQETVKRQVQEFATATDETGKLAHPYFNDVQHLITSFISSGAASDLHDAYDMACRAHPEVNSKIAAAKAYEDKIQQSTDARKKSQAARKAGSSVTGTPSGAEGAPAPTGDIREDMRALMVDQGLM